MHIVDPEKQLSLYHHAELTVHLAQLLPWVLQVKPVLLAADLSEHCARIAEEAVLRFDVPGYKPCIK